jgi:tetratricopeptide (TPR) repeat protein
VEEAAGNIDAAAKELQQAAEMDPSEKNVFDFGNLLLRYRAYDGARKILRYGVERYPRSAQLKVAYGVALYSLAQYDQAVETLCEAVDLDPADSRALYFLGKMYDVSPALAAQVTSRLKNFVRQYPQNAAANYFYATSLWKGSGQEAETHLDEVEQLLQKAVTLDPSFHEAHFELGTLYERLNRDEDAIRHYRRATEIRPDIDGPYYRLARLYQRLGQSQAARTAIETYQRLHKQNQSEKEATQPPALIVK